MRGLSSIFLFINRGSVQYISRRADSIAVQCLGYQKCHQLSTSSISRNHLKSLYPDISIPTVLLHEHMIDNFKKFKDRTATECITGRKYTFNDLEVKSKAFAANLRTVLGLQDGEVVNIILPNMPEYPIITLGIIQAKCICSPLNPVYTEHEFQGLLRNSTSKCVVTTKALYPTIRKVIDTLEKQIPVIIFNGADSSVEDGVHDAERFLDSKTDISILSTLGPASPNDVIVLPYSSGTTGLPKGVQLTHKSIVSNLYQLNCHQEILREGGAYVDGQQDTLIIVLPFYHIYGFVALLLDKLKLGYKIITMPKFTSTDFVNLIKMTQPKLLYIVPPIALLISNTEAISKEDLKSIRFVMTGAASLGSSDIEKLKKKLSPSAEIVQGYGLTETGTAVTTFHKYMGKNNPAAIGGLIPNTEAKIVSIETGEMLGPNQAGELIIRGPQVMKGYYNNEDATKEVLTVDGWFRSGDICYYDEDQYIFITDRLKELIKVKGYQVAPAELEEILRSHPNIIDAAVVGVPHPLNGEAPKAYVVTKKGASLTEKDVQDYVLEKASEFKKLAGGVEFVDAIPKSPAGKILRRLLLQK